MADSTIPGLPANAALALADLIEVIDDPGVLPQNMKATIQQVHDAINVLVASGALAVSDVAPVYTGGTAKAATIQKIFDTVSLLAAASTPLVGDEIVPVTQSSVAVRTTVDELIQYSNNNVPNEDTWVIKGATADGDTAATTLGDAMTAGGGTASASAADSTQPAGINELTGAVSGNQGTFVGSAQFRFINRCTLSAMMSLRDTTNVRCFILLCSAQYSTIGGNDGVGVASDWIGFRYSTNTADPAWMYTYGTGGSGSFTTTGVAVNTAAPQLFEVVLRANGTRADFYINRVRVANNIAFTTGTGAALLFTAGVTTLANAAKNIRYYQHKVAQRWF